MGLVFEVVGESEKRLFLVGGERFLSISQRIRIEGEEVVGVKVKLMRKLLYKCEGEWMIEERSSLMFCSF